MRRTSVISSRNALRVIEAKMPLPHSQGPIAFQIGDNRGTDIYTHAGTLTTYARSGQKETMFEAVVKSLDEQKELFINGQPALKISHLTHEGADAVHLPGDKEQLLKLTYDNTGCTCWRQAPKTFDLRRSQSKSWRTMAVGTIVHRHQHHILSLGSAGLDLVLHYEPATNRPMSLEVAGKQVLEWKHNKDAMVCLTAANGS